MNTGLNVLLGTACAVVIVAGGLWVWSQYTQRQANAAVVDFSAVRATCLTKIRELNMGAYKSRPEVDACIAKGYLTLADQQAAESVVGGLPN